MKKSFHDILRRLAPLLGGSGQRRDNAVQPVCRLSGFESLETRRVLDCAGVDAIEECVPGDSDLNGLFDQLDVVRVLQGGRYLTGSGATWQEGDWNEDGTFNQLDIVAVLQAGTYLRIPNDTTDVVRDLSSLAPDPQRFLGAFGLPTLIRDETQLDRMFGDVDVATSISEQVDFATEELLVFSWQGSGQDMLTPTVVEEEDGVAVVFEYTQGLTRDLVGHTALFAIDQDVDWTIEGDFDTDGLIEAQLSRWTGLIESGQLPPGVSSERASEIVEALEAGDLDLFSELTADIPGRVGIGPNSQDVDQLVQTLLSEWTTIASDNAALPEDVTQERADAIVAALGNGDLQLFRDLVADLPSTVPGARPVRGGGFGGGAPGGGFPGGGFPDGGFPDGGFPGGGFGGGAFGGRGGGGPFGA